MKKAKRLVSLLLAIVMLLSLAVSVGAAGVTSRTHNMQGPDVINDPGSANPTDNMQNSGKITITNASVGETYKIYQILYLESYDTTGAAPLADSTNLSGGHYVYKVNTAWQEFVDSCVNSGKYLKYVTTSGAEGSTGEADTNTDNKYVAWITDTPIDADVAEFARAAKAYADEVKDNSGNVTRAAMQPIFTKTATVPSGSTDKTTTINFDDLKLGYYLVDSSLGALCNLDTTNNIVNMEEKNIIPTNYKQVEEDSTNTWSGSATESGTNDADIGQEIDFRSVIRIENGTSVENLTFHDKMDTGLTFSYDPLTEAKNTTVNADGTVVENVNDKIKVRYTTASSTGLNSFTYLVQDTDYKVISPVPAVNGVAEGCTFHIEFDKDFLARFDASIYYIVVEYKGYLNKDAEIGGDGNINSSKISFGDNNTYTTESQTITKTWELPVRKIEGEGQNMKGLAGAKFSLMLNGTTERIKFIKDEDSNSKFNPTTAVEAADVTPDPPQVDHYRVATPEEIAANAGIIDIITTNKDGYFVLVGLDSSTYLLTEEEAPDGYSKLDKPLTIKINDNGSITWNSTPVSGGLLRIQNKAGTELPATGGIGTTIFYVAGSILLVGAAVLLIVKKRMSDEK